MNAAILSSTIGVAILATAGAIAWAHPHRKPPRLPAPPLDDLAFEDLERCPSCGTDVMEFAYEEEVDASGQAVDVFRCTACGFTKPLAPLEPAPGGEQARKT